MDAAHASILGWLTDPDPTRGIRFAQPDDAWDFWPYDRLAGLVARIGAGLIAHGVLPGDVVSIVARSGPHFVATFFGAMAVGATPSPIAPPLTFADRDTYREHVGGLLGTARPRVVVTDADLVDPITAIATTAGPHPVIAAEALQDFGSAAFSDQTPGELALLQFTSGSSGRARGVRVPYPALAANVAAIQGWLGMTPDDPTASWLPVHHDMGLIGCLVTPVVNGSDLWLLPPEEFVRNPLRYLRCFGRDGARLTSMPNFGLGYVARRVKPEALAGLDFSAWRAVIVGAERVDAQVLAAFCELLGPFGLDPRALLPAYGLAEATLAVTGVPLTELWSTVEVAAGTPDAQTVIGCGRPLGAVTVDVVDEAGKPLPDGEIGEIVVRGPSVAAGYVNPGASASLTAIDGDSLRTADAGFRHDGELFVLGRLGDSVKLRGRALFAEDLELALCQAGVPPLRQAALLGYHRGVPTLVAVFEQAQPDWLANAGDVLRRRTEGADVVFVDAPRGSITRTSSGKPKRRQLWQAFIEERLPGTVIGSRPARTATSAGG